MSTQSLGRNMNTEEPPLGIAALYNADDQLIKGE
jgi:hypothetical protein